MRLTVGNDRVLATGSLRHPASNTLVSNVSIEHRLSTGAGHALLDVPGIRFDDSYRYFWTYIPHFIHSPFYVYAYAFGQLLAVSVYGIYEQRGADFVPSYLEMLSAGGSRSPEELARMVRTPAASRLMVGKPTAARAVTEEAGRT